MVRTFGAFLLVFALLSLIVHFPELFVVLGASGLAVCAVDFLLVRFTRDARIGKVHRELAP